MRFPETAELWAGVGKADWHFFGDAVIEGNFTLWDAEALAAALRGGSLPAPLAFDKATTLSKNPPRDGAEKK